MSSLSMFSRGPRAIVSNFSRASLMSRNYGSKSNMQSTQGQASPGTASNVGVSGSSSSDEQQIKHGRGMGSASPDTASIQNPVSNPRGAQVGQQTEDTSTQSAFKQDPNKSQESKKKAAEEQGQKPLDAADR